MNYNRVLEVMDFVMKTKRITTKEERIYAKEKYDEFSSFLEYIKTKKVITILGLQEMYLKLMRMYREHERELFENATQEKRNQMTMDKYKKECKYVVMNNFYKQKTKDVKYVNEFVVPCITKIITSLGELLRGQIC